MGARSHGVSHRQRGAVYVDKRDDKTNIAVLLGRDKVRFQTGWPREGVVPLPHMGSRVSFP